MRIGFYLLFSACIAGAALLVQDPKPAPATPPDPSAILADALGLYRKGSFDPAIARYNDVLKADPSSGDAYAGIIRCYLKQDKVSEADDVLHKALQVNPGHADLKTAEAELLFRQGEIPEAGKLFNEIIAAPPDPAQPNSKPNARAYLGAARVAGASAMYARQHILITRAHTLDASDPDIRKLWMETLSNAERIQSLTEYLGQTNNDDEDENHRLHERLDFLKASQAAQASKCRPVSEVASAKTTFFVISLGGGATGDALAVQIDSKPSKLLLDTGASGITVSSKFAAQAGLKPVSQFRMAGIGDKPEATAHLSWAQNVKIGDVELSNCPVTILDRVPTDTDGIIGADVFSQFLVELDFPTSTFRLSPLPRRDEEIAEPGSRNDGGASPAGKNAPAAPPYEDRYIAPEMHSYTPIFRVRHLLLVPTTINESTSKLFLLDTGAFDNTIVPDAAKETTKVHRAPRIEVRGVNGDVKKVYVAERVTLEFGHVRQTVPNMVSIDMSRTSRHAGAEISGTIGMAMLSLLKVRLDYRDNLADFQYVPKPPRH